MQSRAQKRDIRARHSRLAVQRREDDIQRLFMDGINLFGAYFSAQNLRLNNVIDALQPGLIPYIHRLHPPKN